MLPKDSKPVRFFLGSSLAHTPSGHPHCLVAMARKVSPCMLSAGRNGAAHTLTCLSVRPVQLEERHITGIPEGSLINFVAWSPNGDMVTFAIRCGAGRLTEEPRVSFFALVVSARLVKTRRLTNLLLPSRSPPERGPLSLWVADVKTCVARPLLPGYQLNTVRRSLDPPTWQCTSGHLSPLPAAHRLIRPVRHDENDTHRRSSPTRGATTTPSSPPWSRPTAARSP